MIILSFYWCMVTILMFVKICSGRQKQVFKRLSMIDSSICRTGAQVVGYILIFGIIKCNNATFPRQKNVLNIFIVLKAVCNAFYKILYNLLCTYFYTVICPGNYAFPCIFYTFVMWTDLTLLYLYLLCALFIFTSLHCLILYFCLLFAFLSIAYSLEFRSHITFTHW